VDHFCKSLKRKDGRSKCLRLPLAAKCAAVEIGKIAFFSVMVVILGKCFVIHLEKISVIGRGVRLAFIIPLNVCCKLEMICLKS